MLSFLCEPGWVSCWWVAEVPAWAATRRCCRFAAVRWPRSVAALVELAAGQRGAGGQTRNWRGSVGLSGDSRSLPGRRAPGRHPDRPRAHGGRLEPGGGLRHARTLGGISGRPAGRRRPVGRRRAGARRSRRPPGTACARSTIAARARPSAAPSPAECARSRRRSKKRRALAVCRWPVAEVRIFQNVNTPEEWVPWAPR